MRVSPHGGSAADSSPQDGGEMRAVPPCTAEEEEATNLLLKQKQAERSQIGAFFLKSITYTCLSKAEVALKMAKITSESNVVERLGRDLMRLDEKKTAELYDELYNYSKEVESPQAEKIDENQCLRGGRLLALHEDFILANMIGDTDDICRIMRDIESSFDFEEVPLAECYLVGGELWEGHRLRSLLCHRWQFKDENHLDSVLRTIEAMALGRTTMIEYLGLASQLIMKAEKIADKKAGVYVNDKAPVPSQPMTAAEGRKRLKLDEHPRYSTPPQEADRHIPLERDDVATRAHFERIMKRHMKPMGYKDVKKDPSQSVVRQLIDLHAKRLAEKKAQEELEQINAVIHELEKALTSPQWRWICASVNKKQVWIVDTGASAIFVPLHMKPRLSDWKPLTGLHVKVANGKIVRILGEGYLGRMLCRVIEGLDEILVSVRHLRKVAPRFSINFDKNVEALRWTDESKTTVAEQIIFGHQEGDGLWHSSQEEMENLLERLDADAAAHECEAAMQTVETEREMDRQMIAGLVTQEFDKSVVAHHRMMHFKGLDRQVRKGHLVGADWKIYGLPKYMCDACKRAKAKFEVAQSQQGSRKCVRYCEGWSMDIQGIVSPCGAKFGARYVLVVVCLWSKRAFIRLLVKKTDFKRMLLNIADQVVGEFKAGLIPRSSLPLDAIKDDKLVVQFIWCDGDGIFRGENEATAVSEQKRARQVQNFTTWARENLHIYPNNIFVSPPYKQSFNPEAERHGGQCITDVRAMVYASAMKLKHWDSATVLQSMVRPLLAHRGNEDEISPSQKIYKWIPHYQEIKKRIMTFGAVGYAGLAGDQQVPGKLTDKGVKCHYLHPSLRTRHSHCVLVGSKEFDIGIESCKFDVNRTHGGEWWRLAVFEERYQRIGRHGKIIDLESPLRDMKLLPPLPKLRRADKDAAVRIRKAEDAAERRRRISHFHHRKEKLRQKDPSEVDGEIPATLADLNVLDGFEQSSKNDAVDSQASTSSDSQQRAEREPCPHSVSLEESKSENGTGSVEFGPALPQSTTTTKIDDPLEERKVSSTTSATRTQTSSTWIPTAHTQRADAHDDMGAPRLRQKRKLRSRTPKSKPTSERLKIGRKYVGRFGAKVFRDPTDGLERPFFFVVCRFREEPSDRQPFLCVYPPQQGDAEIDAEEVSAHELRECFKLFHKLDDDFDIPTGLCEELLRPLQKCAAQKRYENLSRGEWEKMVADTIPLDAPKAFKAMLERNMEEFTAMIVGDCRKPYVDPNGHAFTLPELIASAETLLLTKKLNEEDPNFVPRHQSMVPKIKNVKVRKLWLNGERREDHRWHSNETGELRPISEVPKDVKPIPMIRLYKRKPRRAEGLQEKCRCVANASQINNPWRVTYAPVVKALTVRLFFALTAYYRMSKNVIGIDLTIAFIQVFMPEGEHYWLTLPPRWTTPNDDGSVTYWPSNKWVMKIHKYAYGLDTSAQALYKLLAKVLISMGFKRSSHDSCLFYSYENGEIVFVIVYVDDCTWSATSMEILEEIIRIVKDVAKLIVTVEKLPERVVGWNVTYHENDCISLDTMYYEETIVEKYDLDGKLKMRELPGNPALTDIQLEMAGLAIESFSDSDVSFARTVAGEILYLTAKCSPSICAEVNRLCRTCSRPSPVWRGEVLFFVGHLKWRCDKGVRITYYPRRLDQPLMPQIDVFADAGFATTVNGRSLMGYVILFNGAVVGYRSTVTKVATTSTSHAEIFGMCNSVRETVYIWQLLSELGIFITDKEPVPVGIDNQACVRYSYGATEKLLKHVNYKTRYVEDMQEGKVVEVLKIHTEVNLSDPLSKVIKVLAT